MKRVIGYVARWRNDKASLVLGVLYCAPGSVGTEPGIVGTEARHVFKTHVEALAAIPKNRRYGEQPVPHMGYQVRAVIRVRKTRPLKPGFSIVKYRRRWKGSDGEIDRGRYGRDQDDSYPTAQAALDVTPKTARYGEEPSPNMGLVVTRVICRRAFKPVAPGRVVKGYRVHEDVESVKGRGFAYVVAPGGPCTYTPAFYDATGPYLFATEAEAKAEIREPFTRRVVVRVTCAKRFPALAPGREIVGYRVFSPASVTWDKKWYLGSRHGYFTGREATTFATADEARAALAAHPMKAPGVLVRVTRKVQDPTIKGWIIRKKHPHVFSTKAAARECADGFLDEMKVVPVRAKP